MTKQKKPLITRTNVLLLAVILILIWFLTCNPFSSNPIKEPKVKSVKEQAEVVRIDSVASALFKDSVNKIITQLQSEADRWEANWNREVLENRELQDTLGAWLSTTVPDTCKEYQRKAITQYNQLVKVTQSKDNSCLQTIKAKDNIISQKDVLITKHKEDYTKLRINLDTCFAQQKLLEDYAKKVKVRRELYLSVMALGNETKIVNGYGLGLGYRGKNGTAFEIGAMQIGSTINYSISVKKPLIRF